MRTPRAGLFPSNLKMRIASLVVVLVLGATILVTTVALMLAERDMKSVIGDQQFAMLSSAAAFIDDRLDSKKVLLASLAEALPERVRSNPALLQEYLESHPSPLNEFVNVAGFDAEGQLVASLRSLQQIQVISARGKPYFEDTLARKKGLISAPFMSRLSGSPVVLVTQPVFNTAGKVVLVLTAGIDLQRANFLRQIDTLKPGKSGFLFIMTYGGILVDHPTKSRLLEHINARPGVNEATELALKGFEGWTEAKNKEGSPGIYTYKRLKATDWILAARYPTDEAFAPMIAMRSRAMLAAAACALVAGLIGWLAIYRLLGPLEFLRRSVSKIRRKQADIGVLQVARSDEIGELSHAFHALMDEREQAQARTLESEQLVRNILGRAPDAFVTLDDKGHITEWNHQAELTFGWTREEAVGASLATLIVPERYRAAHNEGFAAFATTGTGPVINNRIRVGALHRDGHEIPVELSVGAVAHGKVYYATAFLHDVSERVAFEEQVTASVRRARIIADTMPALISYVDAGQRYRFTNAYYRDLLDTDPESLIGKTVLEVRGAEAYGRLKGKIEAALRGERMHFEHAAVENGRKIHLLIDYIPEVAADGSVAGFYTMALDISERKNAELVQAASEKRLKLITDNVPVLISYIDTNQRIQFGNATYERWFGVSPAQLVDRSIREVFGEEAYELGVTQLEAAFTGKVTSYEAQAEGDDPRVLEVTFVPDVQTDGSVAGVYALAQDMTRVKAVEEKLKQLARVDSLTGIANRRSFVETLAMAIDRSRRHGNLMALAYLDIDHFKKINDTYGHATGDDVLKEFARRLVAIVRSTDTVARLSGDEFVIILDDIAEAHEVATIAGKIVEVVRMPFELSAARLNVTTSVGIALHASESQAELLAHADAALYQAKRDGRNRFAVHAAD